MIDKNQMRSWADEAVAKAKATGVTLDYTRSTIAALEQALDAQRDPSRDSDATWDLACRFGAYLGEVMLTDFAGLGYEWAEDYDGEPCLITSQIQEGANLNKILPITKCNKYLLSGNTESVAKLYAMCLSMLKGGDTAENLASLGIDTSQVSGIEPAYVLNGRFNANAAAWLLYGDYFFFRDEEIVWDGTTHRPVGGQINSAKANEIPTLLSNLSLLNGMLDLLVEIEKDEGLRVPLYMIHPGVRSAIRDEDLTGITLFNLMAQAQALIIKESEPDKYSVVCDSRLAQGIPSFYQLVASMIWDMREYNQRSGSYEVTFANARNIDADQVVGQVNELVPGAFSNAIWQMNVTEKPQVELPSEEEARAFTPSESNFEPFITISFDDDEESEEEFFERALDHLAHELPITKDIEGTHHMGRILRIEHVKVGDSLVLAADWQNEWFDPVCIEVFNAQGETLGNLSQLFLYPADLRELACLLPHITATVESVTPKSKRRKNAKYALMDVRMEIDPAVLGPGNSLLLEYAEEAKALLELPEGERVVLSKGNLVASQLKGNIKVDEAHDAPNPIGTTFHLWDTETGEPAKPTAATAKFAAAATQPQQQPEQPVAGPGRWTFNVHKTAQGRRFTIEVPDQYVLTPEEKGRPLAHYVEGIDDETDYYPEINYSAMIGDYDEETKNNLVDNLIPGTRIQMQRKAAYGNDLANKIMRLVNDWVVDGKNCKVMVLEFIQPSVFPDMYPDNHEYHVKPIAYDHEDYLRITDSSQQLGEGDLKALAFAVATTIELDAPVELRRPAELRRYCEEQVDSEEFCETVTVIANMLNLGMNERFTANLHQAVRRADNDTQVLDDGETIPRVLAESLNKGIEESVVYFEQIVTALEKQAEFGAEGFGDMWEIAGTFAEARITERVTTDDEDTARKAESLGIISIPESYYSLRERYEALKPGADGKAGKRLENDDAAIADAAAKRKAEAEAEREAEELRRLTTRSLNMVIAKNAQEDGYCDFDTIARAYDGIASTEEIKTMLDDCWFKSTLRKRTTAEGEYYAIGWTDDAWREARDSQNERFAAEQAELERQARQKYTQKVEAEIAKMRGIEVSNERGIAEAKESQLAIQQRIDEALPRTDGLREDLAKKEADAKSISDELGEQGFFAFGKKKELKVKLKAAQQKVIEARQTVAQAESKLASLDADLKKEQSKEQRCEGVLAQARNVIAKLEKDVDRELPPVDADAYGRIRTMMELWACPVTAAWCTENVFGIQDEEKTSRYLRYLADSRDALEILKGQYVLTGPRSFERDVKIMSYVKRDGIRAASLARQANVSLFAEVYKKMPSSGRGLTTKEIVDLGVNDVWTTQKAAAIIRIGVTEGYIDKVVTKVGDREEVRYVKRAEPRKESSLYEREFGSVEPSEGRKENEKFAKQIHEKLPYLGAGVTTSDVVQMGIPGISTTQKAAAVMRVGIEQGLFSKTEESGDGKTIYRYHKEVGWA